MALRRVDKPQWGVQFHPESIGTQHGEQLMRQLIAATGVLPLWHRKVAETVDPAAVVATWRERYPYVCWLDTATGDGMHLIGAGHRLVSPNDVPQGLLTRDSVPSPINFVPGALGVLPYEATALIDGGAFQSGQLLVPEVVYQLCNDAAFLLSRDGQQLGELVPPPAPARPSAEITLRHRESEYTELIDACQEAIRAGESYELCLTTSASAEVEADPLALYLTLRHQSPSPMAGLFLGEASVLSASPERFVQVRGSRVSACPIKGTRPRSEDPQEDERLRGELADSAKDRAENIMIVDLLRNDLSRSCTPASIEVPELCQVHTFSRAHQMISTISGTLLDEVDTMSAVQAVFPGGSMTGAPKQRSMDILARLEGQPRGFYSGCMGYVSATGDADFSILIRTVTMSGSDLTYGAGGAITALSDPAEEYAEVLVKMQPFRLLLGQP